MATNIKDHPILVVLSLIVGAFVAGVGAYIWVEKELDKKIKEKLPAGWAICNGDNGTPDLRNKFVKGAERLADNGKTGGTNSQTITIERPRLFLTTGGTNHPYALREEQGRGIINHQTGCGICNLVNSFIEEQPTISKQFDNRPEHTELVFIMKIKEK